MLLQLLQGLEALGRAVQPGGGGLAALGDWRPVEAALYCVRSIGDSVPSGLPVAGQLMQLLPVILMLMVKLIFLPWMFREICVAGNPTTQVSGELAADLVHWTKPTLLHFD